jgi:tetratricopeptide (TPR) repeat protein
MIHVRYRAAGVFTALALLASPAFASFTPSPAEMAALPPYCAARFDENSAAFKTWRATMGSDFIHVHHYCAGLNFLNRAYGISSAKDRQGTLAGAVRNFDYVLTHTQPTFYLRADALMNRGIASSLMQKQAEAMQNLKQALEMNPKLVRAYVALADLYEKQKNRGKALDTVSEGLRQNPDTRSLQRRYTELGGKLPYPAAAAAPTAAQTDSTAPAASAAPQAATPDTASPTAAPVPPVAAPPEAIAPQKIGSPTNPYCRFCPD